MLAALASSSFPTIMALEADAPTTDFLSAPGDYVTMEADAEPTSAAFLPEASEVARTRSGSPRVAATQGGHHHHRSASAPPSLRKHHEDPSYDGEYRAFPDADDYERERT